MNRIRAMLIALDQLAAAILFGWPDVTLSAWAWWWHYRGIRSWPRRWIDRLFFWDLEHCYHSYQSEVHRTQYPPDFLPTPEADDAFHRRYFSE